MLLKIIKAHEAEVIEENQGGDNKIEDRGSQHQEDARLLTALGNAWEDNMILEMEILQPL